MHPFAARDIVFDGTRLRGGARTAGVLCPPDEKPKRPLSDSDLPALLMEEHHAA